MKTVQEAILFGVQSTRDGRMAAILAVDDKVAFLVNPEHTLLMRFDLMIGTQSAYRFRCGDYESGAVVSMEGDNVVFAQGGDVPRRKTVPAPSETFEQLEAVFSSLSREDGCGARKVRIEDGILRRLTEDLSHVEIGSNDDGEIVFVQRDLYGGGKLEVGPFLGGGSFGLKRLCSRERVSVERPFALRTRDLFALLMASPWLEVSLSERSFTMIRGKRLKGFVGNCVYDELGGLTYEEIRDGQEANEGRSKGRSRGEGSRGRRRRFPDGIRSHQRVQRRRDGGR